MSNQLKLTQIKSASEENEVTMEFKDTTVVTTPNGVRWRISDKSKEQAVAKPLVD